MSAFNHYECEVSYKSSSLYGGWIAMSYIDVFLPNKGKIIAWTSREKIRTPTEEISEDIGEAQ